MAYLIGQAQTGQTDNLNSSPVVISSGQISNNQLASDESLILLRRIVKLLESNAVVDAGNRQRISLDASTVTLTANVSNLGTIASQGLQQFVDVARNAYANGIRSKLNFS